MFDMIVVELDVLFVFVYSGENGTSTMPSIIFIRCHHTVALHVSSAQSFVFFCFRFCILEISRKDAEIRRLIELKRSTPKEKKQRVKEIEKKHQKNVSEKRKECKDNKKSKKFLQTSKVSATSQEIKSAKKKRLITKIKNERRETITSRKNIANVFGEFHNKLYDDNEQDEDENESNIDVHIIDTEEMMRIPDEWRIAWCDQETKQR